ncbi:ABC transporter ATP-binding protein [Microbacterium keratanolyticum]
MIEVKSVSKTFGTHRAARDVSFAAPAGQITAFVGPNGAGKSTVLRIIAGIAIADEGHVLIEGRPFADAANPAETLGVFLSAETIPVKARTLDHLHYLALLQGRTLRDAQEALAQVGLSGSERTRVGAMSLGMRQRLGIAAAGLGAPRVLVLDEPANGLDPAGVQWFRDHIVHLARHGVTVLLSSHHMTELALVADRVVMIDRGQIVAEGTVADFVATDSTPPVHVRTSDPARLLDMLTARGLNAGLHDDGIVVHGTSAHEVGRIAYTDGPGVTHLAIIERSIEQTYFDRLQPVGQEGTR